MKVLVFHEDEFNISVSILDVEENTKEIVMPKANNSRDTVYFIEIKYLLNYYITNNKRIAFYSNTTSKKIIDFVKKTLMDLQVINKYDLL